MHAKKEKTASKKTLDSQHQAYMSNMNTVIDQLKEMEAELEQMCDALKVTEAKRRAEGLTDEELEHYLTLQDARIALEERMANLNKTNEVNYLTNTADILFKYYDILEKGGGGHMASAALPASTRPQNSILKWFGAPASTATAMESKPSTLVLTAEKQPSLDANTKTNLLEEYMTYIDEYYVRDVAPKAECCGYCKSTHIHVNMNDGQIICNMCHGIEYIIVDHEKPSYRDPPKEITCFAYKRINHLNEWINQIQGKETTDIPDEIYDRIMIEIKKQRITNMASLTQNKVREILKTLGLHKYYEHTPHIVNRLNGLPMPHLPPELEEKLRIMFKQVQVPYVKHMPTNRKNFLSYSYVLHKFLQLLEKDDLLVHFPLLKSRDKLHAQDSIWKKICEELGWEFYRSI